MCCGQLVKKRDFMSIAQVPQTLSEPSMGEFVYGTCNRDGVKSRFLTLSATHCPSQASAFATQKKTCIPESKLTYTRQYFYSALLNTSLSTAPFWQATMVVQTASPVILTAVLAISRIRSIPMIIPIASTGSRQN